MPQIEVKVDLKKAQQHGLKPGDVRRAASYIVAGEEVGDLHIGNRTFDVNVWSVPESRGSLSDIRGMLLDTPHGGRVRLDEVASVEIVPTPNVINRDNLKRKIDVGANVKGRDLGSVYNDVKAALATVEFPHEYHPELLGEYTERKVAQRRLFVWGVIAVVGIFFFLQVSFGSWRLASISFL